MKKKATKANLKQMMNGAQPAPANGMADGGQMSMPAQQPMSPNYVPPAPPPTPASQTMANGGESSSNQNTPTAYDGIKGFFSDVNILDVAISAFLVAGITYIIYYHKYMLKLEKTGYADLSDRVMKLESAIAAREAQLNAAGSMNKTKRPLMRLG